MRHKHADMIIAKAENMDLVVFVKNEKWETCHETVIPYHSIYEYFLCLPQHREACLHWLNGGSVQWGNTNHDKFDWYPKDNIGINDINLDMGYFLDESFIIRIKPRKEKRWVATFPWCGNAFYVVPESFSNKELLSEYINTHYGERKLIITHEIEVEV